MQNFEHYKTAIEGAMIIALATSVENSPNVRVVNYLWEEKTPNMLYFTSFKGSKKSEEFIKNDRVAIATIPADVDAMTHLRSKNALVRKSQKTIAQVRDAFVAKMPFYAEMLDNMGDNLDLFEIEIKDAEISIGYEENETISF